MLHAVVLQLILVTAYASKMAHHVEGTTMEASCIPDRSKHSKHAILKLILINHTEKMSTILYQ